MCARRKIKHSLSFERPLVVQERKNSFIASAYPPFLNKISFSSKKKQKRKAIKMANHFLLACLVEHKLAIFKKFPSARQTVLTNKTNQILIWKKPKMKGKNHVLFYKRENVFSFFHLPLYELHSFRLSLSSGIIHKSKSKQKWEEEEELSHLLLNRRSIKYFFFHCDVTSSLELHIYTFLMPTTTLVCINYFLTKRLRLHALMTDYTHFCTDFLQGFPHLSTPPHTRFVVGKNNCTRTTPFLL